MSTVLKALALASVLSLGGLAIAGPPKTVVSSVVIYNCQGIVAGIITYSDGSTASVYRDHKDFPESHDLIVEALKAPTAAQYPLSTCINKGEHNGESQSI